MNSDGNVMSVHGDVALILAGGRGGGLVTQYITYSLMILKTVQVISICKK